MKRTGRGGPGARCVGGGLERGMWWGGRRSRRAVPASSTPAPWSRRAVLGVGMTGGRRGACWLVGGGAGLALAMRRALAAVLDVSPVSSLHSPPLSNAFTFPPFSVTCGVLVPAAITRRSSRLRSPPPPHPPCAAGPHARPGCEEDRCPSPARPGTWGRCSPAGPGERQRRGGRRESAALGRRGRRRRAVRGGKALRLRVLAEGRRRRVPPARGRC